MKSLLALAVVVTVFLSGCGNSTLTPEQKTQFKEVTKAASTVISSSDRAPGRPARAKGDANDVQTRISKKLNTPACKTEMLTPTSNAVSMQMSMKISGTNCPLEMELSVAGTAMAPTMKIFFEIKDAELLELSDVSKMELNGKLALDENGGGNGSFTGYIQSKKQGRVGLNLAMSGNKDGGKYEITYAFSKFDVKIGATIVKEKVEYTLNGNKISPEELRELIENGSLVPGMKMNVEGSSEQPKNVPAGGGPVAGPAGGGAAAFSYNLTFNGCSTGVQTFPSLQAMCDGLQKNGLNRGCALEMRKAHFTRNACPGVFVEKP